MLIRALAALVACWLVFVDPPAAAKGQRDPLAPIGEPATVPSEYAMQVMTWVAASGDNNGAPYMVVDKFAAEVFLFDGSSQLIASSPALVGLKVGDESTPGVGDRELSSIPPGDRTTPAGRFVAKFGRAAGHRDVLWIDYPTAISLHAVVNIQKQHRLERLRSSTPTDNRITYGCINVPADFYTKAVKPLFRGTSGVVYVLPETRPLSDIFPAMPPRLAYYR
jgi:hypothetical protein